VTSAVYSPRLKQNIALAMVAAEHAHLGADVEVVNRTGLVNEAGTERAVIVERPFFDPKKKIAAA
jgi:aminomethyltransferase